MLSGGLSSNCSRSSMRRIWAVRSWSSGCGSGSASNKRTDSCAPVMGAEHLSTVGPRSMPSREVPNERERAQRLELGDDCAGSHSECSDSDHENPAARLRDAERGLFRRSLRARLHRPAGVAHRVCSFSTPTRKRHPFVTLLFYTMNAVRRCR